MKIPSAPNMNYAWSQLIVRELLRLGVRGFFVAPGSRSSPLALTVAELASDQLTVHFDERGLGFMALGCARATGRPAVIITTSGSAVANLFPAVCEAAMDEVPLMLLTADRPPELRDCGANQAMDQVRIFGSYARWFCDVPCPSKDLPPSFLLGTIDEAFFAATGRSPGPVHLNQMFREPLAPERNSDGAAVWLKSAGSWWTSQEPMTRHSAMLSKPSLAELLPVVRGARRGLVVAGAARHAAETDAMLQIAAKLGWPLLPDIRSGLRLVKSHPQIIAMADQILLKERSNLKPDVVLHVGGRVTSKRMMKLMREAHVMHVSATPARIDPDHVVRARAVCSLSHVASQLDGATRTPTSWLSLWKNLDRSVAKIWHEIVHAGDVLDEPLVAASVSRMLAKGEILYLASSMPVRDMDMFGVGVHAACTVVANRGVSGIDGTIASAVGYAKGAGAPVTLLIGDLALLHDLNSLALVAVAKVPVKVVVVNNNGGGIFSFLPVAGAGKHYETCFGTPHGMRDFSAAAKQFGIAYRQPVHGDELKEALGLSGAAVIEIKTTRRENARIHAAYQDRLRGV